MMNICVCVDLQFPSCHDHRTLSIRTYFNVTRFILELYLTIKFGLLSILNESQPHLRSLILDWTIVEPEVFRIHLVRSFFAFIILGLCLKTGMLFNRNFHGNIVEFMTQDPRSKKERDRDGGINQKERSGSILEINTGVPRTYPRSDHGSSDKSWLPQASEFFRLLVMRNWARLVPLPRPKSIKKHGSSNLNYAKAFHSIDNWFLISRQLERRFKLTLLITSTLYGSLTLTGFIKMFLLMRRKLANYPQFFLLGSLAFFELAFLITDGFVNIIGYISHINLMVNYFTHLFKWSRDYFSNYIALLDQSADWINRLASGSKVGDKKEMNYTDRLHRESNSVIILEYPSKEQQLYRKRNSSSNLWDLHRNVDYMLSSFRPHTFKPTSFSELDGYLETRPIINNEINHTNMNYDLESAKKVVSDILHAIDEQKEFVAYVGVVEYLWLGTSLSLVPMLVIISRIGINEALPLVDFITIGLITQIVCFRIAKICADINYNAIGIGKLMFRICARYPSQKIHNEWSRMFYNWYYPAKCVFKVAGVFELTYANILKTISYMTTLITLLLNYSTISK